MSARDEMLDAVARITDGHVGLYNERGQYEGGCRCGWRGVDITSHIEDAYEIADPPPPLRVVDLKRRDFPRETD